MPLPLLLICTSSSALLAGQAAEGLTAGDVFVGTIVRVEDRGATNARPPRVWVEVEEVLQGDAKVPRSPAVWGPRFHGVDWVGEGSQEALESWAKKPLAGPKVGEKFILGGRVLTPAEARHEASLREGDKAETPVYRLFSFVSIPYSDQARARVLAELKMLDDLIRQRAAEEAAAAKELDRRRREWRAVMTAERIDQRTQQADAVAIANYLGDGCYEVERLVKGRPRLRSGVKYYVTVPTKSHDPRIVDLLHDKPRVVVFLSEQNLVAAVTTVHAELVDPYEGVMLADFDAIEAVEASLQKRPAPPPRPVLVISALDKGDAAPLAAAARKSASLAVVISQQFSYHGPNLVPYVRQTIPKARVVVTIDRAPARRVVATLINTATTTVLHEGDYRETDVEEHFQTLVRKLVEAIP